MKIQVTFDITTRCAEGWSTPPDADEVAEWIKGEWAGSDVEDNAVAFEVIGIETKVLES